MVPGPDDDCDHLLEHGQAYNDHDLDGEQAMCHHGNDQEYNQQLAKHDG